MIQSHHILEDRGHRIYYGQMSQDDTIPLHSRRLRSPGQFRESSQGWHNPTAIITTPPFGEGLFEPHQASLESVRTLLGTEALSTHQQLVH